MSTEPKDTDSALRAQHDADDMGVTEADEQDQADRFERTGEPRRDNLGNEDGAS